MKKNAWIQALFVALCAGSLTASAQTITDTFTTSGTFTVPAGVTNITVQAWGGGGGTRNESDRARGGGGGGAFAQRTLTVTPAQTFTVTVGAGGQPAATQGASGGSSWFGSTSTVYAAGGIGGDNTYVAGGAGSGGAAASSVGAIRWSGGNGGSRGGTTPYGGGGGGGSATPTAAGGNGGDGTATVGGAGGTGTGPGGAGGYPNALGASGSAPGGGGGGRGSGAMVGGSAGARGEVRVIYTIPPPPTAIAFATPTRTVYDIALAFPVTIELRTAGGIAAPSVGATTINLSSSLGGTFRNSADTADIASVTIPAGQTSASFRYRPNVLGAHALTMTDAAAALTSASQTWQVFSVLPAVAQTFYMPLPEADILTYLSGVHTAAVNPMQRYAAITTVSAGTIIFYDQRENGYEADLRNPASIFHATTNPSGTQIWGDSNPANGAPPGFPDDFIPAGALILLNNAVNTATQPTVAAPLFNGGDKMASSKAIALTTTVWASGSNTLFTDATEVYDMFSWGADYRVPVGQNILAADQNEMFERVGASIMAGPGGATVQIDADNNGVFETTVVLTEGSAHLVNGGLLLGARIVSDRPVQVDVLTGDVGANYESRWFRLLPTTLWTSSYYTPVSTPSVSPMSAPGGGILTSVWLYNPNASAITVAYARRGGAGLIRNVSEEGTAYAAHSVDGSAFDNVVGPIFALNADGTATGAPEGAWIGIVSRGATSIATQVANAQAAGAAAVIVHHNVAGSTTFETAGTGRYIPVVGVTLADGNALRAGGLGSGWVRVSGDLVSSNVSVPASGYARVTMEDGYGGRFSSIGGNFYAVSTTDSTGTPAQNQTWDWGFTLVPQTALTSQLLIGLGIGRDPTATEYPTENGSPVWVSTAGNGNTNVTVYVDFDANPATGPFTDPNGYRYDLALTLRELEKVTVYNPSGNQSGMLLYTLERGVKLVGAWGQDPQQSSGGRPGLDMGTGIPPLPIFTATKRSIFLRDNDGDGFPSPGDDLDYQITIENISRVPVDDLTVRDILPAAVDYLPGTTTFTDHNGITSPITDNSVSPLFPLAPPGIVFNAISLPPARSWVLRYDVRIKPFPNLPPGTITLVNSAIVNSLVVDDPISLEQRDPVYGRIGDRVWHDVNGDGIQDAGESGMPNVVVRLFDGSDNPLATTTTDANGNYIFFGVLPGDYRVEFMPPPGYLFSPQDADAAGLRGLANSDPIPATGSTALFTLAAGEPLTQVDAGLYLGAVIGDRVWHDEDGDGAQDAGENGIANVTVALRDAGNNLIATTITDAHGGYLFQTLPPGAYTARVVSSSLPAGLAAGPTFDEDGIATPHQSAVTVGIGTVHRTADFGYALPAMVHGYLFRDETSDLLRNTGDTSISNTLVRLVVHGAVVATTFTDAWGYYRFDSVPAGPVSVLVSRANATLISVPVSEPDASDQRRNRGWTDHEGYDAYIAWTVLSGQGVLPDRPAPTLNFGFSLHPLSAALDISLHATAHGVMIELWTVDESGDSDIVVYALLGGKWIEVGRVPAEQVKGEGSNRYQILAPLLSPDGAYDIMVRDEAGFTHRSAAPIAVRAVRMEALRLEMDHVLVTFTTEQGRRYRVETSTDLTTWQSALVSSPTARGGWSAFSVMPFMAGPGPRTEARLPRVAGEQRRFFRAVLATEE